MFFFPSPGENRLTGAQTSVPVIPTTRKITISIDGSDVEIDIPGCEWVNMVKNTISFTPDWRFLSTREFQVMFFYDGLMKGNVNYEEFIKPFSVFMFNAFTVESFSMFKKKLGKLSYPIPLRYKYRYEPFLPIRGELFLVETIQIPRIDQLKMNGIQFIRERVKIRVPYLQKIWLKDKSLMEKLLQIPLKSSYLILKREKFIKAWMYIGVTEFWINLIDGGYSFGEVKTFSSKENSLFNNGKYFYFKNVLETETNDGTHK